MHEPRGLWNVPRRAGAAFGGLFARNGLLPLARAREEEVVLSMKRARRRGVRVVCACEKRSDAR